MGSTFPLLEMEDTRFSRTGGTAEILATGWRPLRRTRAKATRPAKTRKITIRFRSLRSIAPYSDCLGLARPEPAGTRARGEVPLYMCGLLASARGKPEYLILTTGAELRPEMMSISKGFPLMDALRWREDASVSG